jgi:hypothetical protein
MVLPFGGYGLHDLVLTPNSADPRRTLGRTSHRTRQVRPGSDQISSTPSTVAYTVIDPSPLFAARAVPDRITPIGTFHLGPNQHISTRKSPY